MSVPTVTASVVSIDWNVVGGAVATFVVTAFLTWQGLRKGVKKVEEKTRIGSADGEMPIRAGVLMDNLSMAQLSENLRLSRESSELTRQALIENCTAQRHVWEQLIEIKPILKRIARGMERGRDDDD